MTLTHTSGIDIVALSAEELEEDLGCSKLQAKKIVNRIAQVRQEAGKKGGGDAVSSLQPLTDEQRMARRGSAAKDWASVLDQRPASQASIEKNDSGGAEGAGGTALSEKEAKQLRKQVRDLKRKKKVAEGEERAQLKTEIAKLEALLTAGGGEGGGGVTDYRDYQDLTGDGGVLIKMLKTGSGISPEALSKVEVHFVGKLKGGEEFHSTHVSGHAVSFLLGTGQTIKGLETAIKAMKAGARALVVIAPEYAYGNKGRAPHADEPEVPPGATLEYEISLISFQAKPGTPASLASDSKAQDLQAQILKTCSL